MGNTISEVFINFLGLAIAGLIGYQIVTIILYNLFFLPYRNRFMCWFMKRFNKNYLAAKQIFDELLAKQEEIQRGAINVQDGYYKFLEYMHGDTRFRSLDEARELWSPKQEPQTTEKVLSTDTLSTHDMESFICFRGSGVNVHKVQVYFEMSNQDGIWLKYIWFFYHEETKSFNSFFYNLEQKKFESDPDPRGDRPKRYKPVAGPSVKVPDLVTA